MKSRFSTWGPRKVKSNAHLYAVFRIVEEEVKEAEDSVLEQLWVEIWKDRESFIEMMVENLKKVEEVEVEMTGGVKRTFDDMEGFATEEPDDLNDKVSGLLNRFEGKSLLFITKFFKVIHKNHEPNLAISHPRIQKRAGELSYNLSFKKNSLKTDCAALTNLDSEVMTGRGNIGPAFCTLVPLKDLSNEVADRVLAIFNMEVAENVIPPTNSSQDFPFTQSQTEETLMVCQVCRYATRDKSDFKNHLSEHYQCDTCGLFYGTQKDLDYHVLDHKKVKCSKCNKFIRKDEMLTHEMNHLKLKTFGKKVVRTKVVKPVTGYGMWQKEERQKILQEQPQRLYTDVGRELGKRWKLVSVAEKNALKTQAEEFNKTLKQKETATADNLEPVAGTSTAPNLTIEEDEVVIEVDVIEDVIGDETNAAIEDALSGSNQNHLDVDDLMNLSIETLEPARKRKKTVNDSTDCPLCDFQAETNQGLATHMRDDHAFTQSTILDCKVCKKLFIQESKLKEHMKENHGEVVDKQTEIILVKLRTLAWPAVVVRREDDMILVKMISDDSEKMVKENDTEVFDVEKITNTKNPKLKN